jgi:hypothetical protein
VLVDGELVDVAVAEVLEGISQPVLFPEDLGGGLDVRPGGLLGLRG